MQRILTSASLLALLLFGATLVISNVTQAPAFNADLRVADVYGREQTLLTESMYDYPNYLLQIATTYGRADLLPSGDTEGQGEYASTELAMERAALAVDLLLESVAFDPANSLAWEQLAWSLALNGEFEAARHALMQSWVRAPRNGQSAPIRLDLAVVLFAVDTEEGIEDDLLGLKLNAQEATAISRDLDTLLALSPREYAIYSEDLKGILN